MPSAVLIVDSYFTSYAGHNALYNGALHAACLRRGLGCEIVAGSDLASVSAGTLPLLSSPRIYPLRRLVSRSRVFSFLWKIPFCNARRLWELLTRVGPRVPSRSTVVVSDLSTQSFLADCLFWGLIGLLGRRATVFFVLHDRPGKWFYFASMLGAGLLLTQKMVLALQSEALVPQHRSLSPIRTALHVPTPQASRIQCTRCEDRPAGKSVTFACLGLTSRPKGTDIMLRAVSTLCRRRTAALDQIRFIVQISPHDLARLGDDALSVLETLRGDQRVRIIEGALLNEDYAALISSADCLVLPYRAEYYRYIQSGIFVEAIAAGKPVIVPAGTAMENDCVAYRLGLTFQSGDADDLLKAIVAASADIDELIRSVRENAGAILRKHDIDRYVDALVEYGPAA